MSAYIFDTETTGFSEPVRLVEAAWIRATLTDTGIIAGESWHNRYFPDRKIEFGAMEAHNITNEDVQDQPLYSTFSLPMGTQYLVGHNIDYDWKVIGAPPIRRICTLALSRLLWPDTDSFSLGAMLYALEGAAAKDMLVNSHSATADVVNTLCLLQHIIPNLPGDIETWEQVWEHSEKARIPEIMTFGKWKGMLIKNVPADYIQWLLNQPDLEPYLEIALKKRVTR